MTERFLLVLIMFLGASWSDLRTRRVANRYWLPFVVAAAILWAADLVDDVQGLAVPAIGAASMTVLAYLMWRMGSFGGADAKGLMVFAWLWPGAPELLAGRTLPVLDTLANAAVVAILMPGLFLLVNLVRGDLAFPASLLGTRILLKDAEARHVWPLQRVDGVPGEERLRWHYWQRPAEPLEEAYGRLRRMGIQHVWVTPKIPFMVPLTLGAMATWAYGNVVLRLLLQA